MTTRQNTRPDPLTTLAALRPDTSGRAWGAVHQAAARERVMAASVQDAAPDVDFQCTVILNESPDSAQRPPPSVFRDVSGTSCGSEAPDPRFAIQGGDADLEHGTWSWFGTSGDAVHGDVVTASGQRYPAVVSDGRIYGWYPRVAGQPQGRRGPGHRLVVVEDEDEDEDEDGQQGGPSRAGR